MMKRYKICAPFLIIFLFLHTLNCYAETAKLSEQRLAVVKQYINALNQKNYRAIAELFVDNRVAISSKHVYQHLLAKTSPLRRADLSGIRAKNSNSNMMALYLNFSWIAPTKENQSAKFLNLIIFEDNTAKIKDVYFFRNQIRQDYEIPGLKA